MNASRASLKGASINWGEVMSRLDYPMVAGSHARQPSAYGVEPRTPTARDGEDGIFARIIVPRAAPSSQSLGDRIWARPCPVAISCSMVGTPSSSRGILRRRRTPLVFGAARARR
jgi:hypothetical protein